MSFQNWFAFWVTSYWTNSLINQAELVQHARDWECWIHPLWKLFSCWLSLRMPKVCWKKTRKNQKRWLKCFFAKSFESMLEAVQNPVKNVRGSQFYMSGRILIHLCISPPRETINVISPHIWDPPSRLEIKGPP